MPRVDGRVRGRQRAGGGRRIRLSPGLQQELRGGVIGGKGPCLKQRIASDQAHVGIQPVQRAPPGPPSLVRPGRRFDHLPQHIPVLHPQLLRDRRPPLDGAGNGGLRDRQQLRQGASQLRQDLADGLGRGALFFRLRLVQAERNVGVIVVVLPAHQQGARGIDLLDDGVKRSRVQPAVAARQDQQPRQALVERIHDQPDPGGPYLPARQGGGLDDGIPQTEEPPHQVPQLAVIRQRHQRPVMQLEENVVPPGHRVGAAGQRPRGHGRDAMHPPEVLLVPRILRQEMLALDHLQ